MNSAVKQEAITTPAVRRAFKAMPKEFYITQLIAEVRRPGLFRRVFGAKPVRSLDTTILRILRREREKNPQEYGYIVVDHNHSLYQKIA